MNDELNKSIEQVKCLIEKKELEKAMKILTDASKNNPKEGLLDYYFGKCVEMLGETELANKFYISSLKKGYRNIDLLILYAKSEHLHNNLKTSEKLFNMALDYAKDESEILKSNSEYALFYVRNHMALNAEKLSKKLINDFPNSYNGYHIHVLCEIEKKEYLQASAYLNGIFDEFKEEQLFLVDFLTVYELAHGIDETIKYIDDNTLFIDKIPQYCFRKKREYYNRIKDYDNVNKMLFELAKTYGDIDATISLILILFANKKYSESAKLGALVLENEKDKQNMRFFITLVVQIFSFYYMSNKMPSAKLAEWIEKSGNWCIDFAMKNGTEQEAIELKELICNLFNEINSLSKV